MGAAAGKPGRALIAAAVAALLLLAAAPGDASRVPRGLRRMAPRGARLPEAEGGEAGGPLRGGAQTYGGSSNPASAASTFPHRLLKARAEAQLDQIADWVMTLGLASNNVTGTHEKMTTSVFMNGNLARILLAHAAIVEDRAASREAAGDGAAAAGLRASAAAERAEGLAWCDTFVDLALPIETSLGENGTYWDTGYNEVYIADTGTAVTTLAVCAGLLPEGSARRAAMVGAMERYHLYVVHGCVDGAAPPHGHDPEGTCPPKGTGFVLDDGSLGDGYYQNAINLTPYTIATATTGGVFYTELNELAPAPEYVEIASNSVDWLLSTVEPNGTLPYILTPAKGHGNFIYQATTYSTEAFVDAWLRRPEQRAGLQKALAPTIAWLVKTQNADGLWGDAADPKNGENQRSPRAGTLLQWWVDHAHPHDPAGELSAIRAQLALRKYLLAVTDPTLAAKFGENDYSLITGFIGLVLADYVKPWSTFLPVQK